MKVISLSLLQVLHTEYIFIIRYNFFFVYLCHVILTMSSLTASMNTLDLKPHLKLVWSQIRIYSTIKYFQSNIIFLHNSVRNQTPNSFIAHGFNFNRYAIYDGRLIIYNYHYRVLQTSKYACNAGHKCPFNYLNKTCWYHYNQGHLNRKMNFKLCDLINLTTTFPIKQ